MTQQEQEADARAMVRRVFSTPEGKKVFVGLMLDLGLYSQATDQESVVKRNFAQFYLKERIGLYKAQDAAQVIELMLALGK